jgi:phosphate starvation-inducible PhoH-like protein
VEHSITLPQGDQRLAIVGPSERNLKIIREGLGVKVWSRNGTLGIEGQGKAVGQALYVLEQLTQAAKQNRPMDRQHVLEAVSSAGHMSPDAMTMIEQDQDLSDGVEVYTRGRRVKPMTPGQHAYLEAIQNHDLTFCTGPAGTGKTYLAVAAAVSLLRCNRVRKIVLVRPAVEAGEKLGFLPGDMQQKVNPYLRPLLDALEDVMEFDQVQRFLASDLIEIIPLAFMRGRTLNDAVVILDEAQNTTKLQMLMFLTRLGHRSKMVVTGDTSQIDLEDATRSGLVDAVRRLHRVNGVGLVSMQGSDIVRHSLVQQIVEVYGQTTDNKGIRTQSDPPESQ